MLDDAARRYALPIPIGDVVSSVPYEAFIGSASKGGSSDARRSTASRVRARKCRTNSWAYTSGSPRRARRSRRDSSSSTSGRPEPRRPGSTSPAGTSRRRSPTARSRSRLAIRPGRSHSNSSRPRCSREVKRRSQPGRLRRPGRGEGSVTQGETGGTTMSATRDRRARIGTAALAAALAVAGAGGSVDGAAPRPRRQPAGRGGQRGKRSGLEPAGRGGQRGKGSGLESAGRGGQRGLRRLGAAGAGRQRFRASTSPEPSATRTGIGASISRVPRATARERRFGDSSNVCVKL